MKKPQIKSATYKDIYKRSPKYEKYIRQSTRKTYNILEGSIRSSKSVANIMAMATNILLSPDNLHMVCGTTAAVARAVWLENDGLGLLHFFKGRVKETKFEGHKCIEINLENRVVTILVIGMKNAGSYKGFRGMSLGMVGFTELDLLDRESVVEAIGRTLASKHRRFFMDFNPTSEYHQVYSDETLYSPDKLMKTQPDLINYMHCTIHDNPVFTPERIEEVTREYDPDSIPYKRFILGQRVNAEGLIYTIREYNKIKPPKENTLRDKYSRYVIVADPGINSSATVFLLVGLTRNREHVDVLKEYWHRNKDLKRLAVKMPADYVYDFLDFINDSITYMGFKPYSIRTDLDITFKREFNRLKYKKGIGDSLLDVKKDEIDDRIKTGINYLYQGRLRFSTDCPQTIKSWETAVYDETQAVKGKYVRLDDPVKGTMIDCIDATEYAWKLFEQELNSKR